MSEEVKQSIKIKHVPGFLWMPVRTKPRCEKKVAEYCAANNIGYYLPLRRRLHRYGRRTVEFFLPMFAGYVFCNLNEETYQKLVRSNAVAFRITLDEPQEKELLEELEAVKIVEDISRHNEVVVNPELAEGVKVKINAGPMMGVSGIIESRTGITTVSINIDILGQSVSVVMDAGDLEPAND